MTKKEMAKAQLMSLPQVRLTEIYIGDIALRHIDACRINDDVFFSPGTFFCENFVSTHISKGDLGVMDAIPVRTGCGPFVWIVSASAVDRFVDKAKEEVIYIAQQNNLRKYLSILKKSMHEMPVITMTNEDFAAAREHVDYRNRLLQEARKEQNEQMASSVVSPGTDRLVDYDLSVRSLLALKRAGITTVEQLTSLTRNEVLSIAGLGRKVLTDIDDAMEKYGWEYGSHKPVPVTPEKTAVQPTEEETLQQLVDRIEAMGWEVTLRRKKEE